MPEIQLMGPEGEPVDFARAIISHGVAELLPNRVDLEGRTLKTTLPVKHDARTVRITADRTKLKVEVTVGSVAPQLAQTVAHMFRLDEDPDRLLHAGARDVELSWCALGAGRMLRAPTVYEDVVKTV